MILRKGRKPDPKARRMAWIESGRTLSLYGGASQERGERWREGGAGPGQDGDRRSEGAGKSQFLDLGAGYRGGYVMLQ